MDLKKVSLLGDSPPYLPDEDVFFFPSSQSPVWNGLTFATPPLSPVDTATADKEITTHLSSYSEQLPDELLSNSREDNGRAESPAILNDIMWNAGQRAKRPDSAMDIDVRFHLNSTPVAFDQPIANTFVDSEDLFSFSFLDTEDNDSTSNRQEECIASNPFQDLSDSDEEIDVVSIQIAPKRHEHNRKHEECMVNKKTDTEQNIQLKNTENSRPNSKVTLQKTRDKKEDGSASESDCENTRISHNDLERKRRNELRNRFIYLRESIPSLMNNEKAAKITILRKAHDLIKALEKEEKEMIAEKDFERQKNADLLRKITKLTRASKAKLRQTHELLT